ncbi:glycosyltransferase [Flaviramulus sp. BrNp1-15]|uniref:glycosyltransferase n=1 Tax=Flaviramulus sp. BrNp1-15 TaxID=2916754 RepID=UPI001EE99D14|nr:glycosyltransferase [Flaviramulus sp. BrNp1-15]ULC58997.1 glycosyltransferase [Flaviramulus sp. BrNp1-15]
MSKKICLLVDSLSSGGAEKLAANTSLLLNKKGYEVYIVTMQNSLGYQYKGELYNFGLIKEKNNIFKAFFKFKNFFKIQNFDLVIDHRVRSKYLKEFLFSRLIFQKELVLYYIHNYDLSYSFSFLNSPKLAIIPHVKQKVFISVCKEVQEKLKKDLRIESEVIYNYITEDLLAFQSKRNSLNYIIGVGRLTKIKQFEILIKSYSESKLPKENIQLIILGDGDEKVFLEKKISDFNLKHLIKISPFKNNPYSLIQNAKALVLTSKVEGFPMVLLESLALNTPVIAFNCKSGPSEIIKNKINGLLVENQNPEALTKAINKLMLDKFFYQTVKENSNKGLNKFSEEKFFQKLENIFENLI